MITSCALLTGGRFDFIQIENPVAPWSLSKIRRKVNKQNSLCPKPCVWERDATFLYPKIRNLFFKYRFCWDSIMSSSPDESCLLHHNHELSWSLKECYTKFRLTSVVNCSKLLEDAYEIDPWREEGTRKAGFFWRIPASKLKNGLLPHAENPTMAAEGIWRWSSKSWLNSNINRKYTRGGSWDR